MNPRTSNVYRHIISFDTPEQKIEFINDNLFEGEDFRKKLEKQPAVKFQQLTSTKAEIKINPTDYKDVETISSLLNKDYLIMKENDEYKYYSIIGTRNTNQIIYQAELDIFMTHDINTMFNDRDIDVKRGMLDRYVYDKEDNLNPGFIGGTKMNFGDNVVIGDSNDNQFFNSEQIEENMKENLYSFNGDNEPIEIDYNSGLVKSIYTYKDENGNPLKDENIKKFWKTFKKLKWNVVFTTEPFTTDKGVKFGFIPGQISNDPDLTIRAPYYAMVAPASFQVDKGLNKSFIQLKAFEELKGVPKQIVISPFSPEFLENAKTLKNSLSLLQLPMMFNCEWVRVIESRAPTVITGGVYHIEFKPAENTAMIEIGEGRISNAYNIYSPDSLENFRYTSNIKPYPTGLLNPTLSINDKVKDNHKYEIKSYTAPYSLIELKGNSQNSFEILPQNLSNIIFSKTNPNKDGFNKLFFEGGNIISYGSDYWLSPVSYNDMYTNIHSKLNNLFKKNYKNNNLFTENNSHLLPTAQVAWEEYQARNANQRAAQHLKTGANASLGIIGAIGGGLLASATGGLSAAVGIGAGMKGLSTSVNAATSINQMAAQKRDLQNTPDQIISSGDSIQNNLQSQGWDITVQRKTIPWNLMIKVREYFYTYGYNLNDKKYNLNDLLKSRYYFNYLEVGESFENIKSQLGTDIKQLVDATLSNGVHIWHYRDKDTWKGIKNYDFENVEMKIYNHKQKGD